MTGTIRALTQANAARLRQRVTEARCVSASFVSSSGTGFCLNPDLVRMLEHFPLSKSWCANGMGQA